MATTLLIVIFLSFVGLGLPDSVLGTAWPAIYREFGLPLSLSGYISVTVCMGSVISSLLSARLMRRFGTGWVTAVSTALTALAMLGYAFAPSPAFFFLLAIPLGLGAGAIDTGLNTFVALHYNASQMSFLHFAYGVGVSLTPFLMSMALGSDNDWRRGYLSVAMIQLVITAVTFVSLPLWRRMQKKDADTGEVPIERTLTTRELIRMPGVLASCFSLFGACALEVTSGAWSSSYFVNSRGLSPDRAATVTMLFYIGMSLGRFLSGALAGRMGRRGLLRVSLWILPAALLLFLLPLPIPVSAAGLFLIGLGVGPIFPNLSHLVPTHFGGDIAQSVIGLQQALTYVGVMVMPWLFGTLAQIFSTALLPYYLVAMFISYAIPYLSLMRAVKRRKE